MKLLLISLERSTASFALLPAFRVQGPVFSLRTIPSTPWEVLGACYPALCLPAHSWFWIEDHPCPGSSPQLLGSVSKRILWSCFLHVGVWQLCLRYKWPCGLHSLQWEPGCFRRSPLPTLGGWCPSFSRSRSASYREVAMVHWVQPTSQGKQMRWLLM